jgi:hypothetical protein
MRDGKSVTVSLDFQGNLKLYYKKGGLREKPPNQWLRASRLDSSFLATPAASKCAWLPSPKTPTKAQQAPRKLL